jgi:hypothetical protein
MKLSALIGKVAAPAILLSSTLFVHAQDSGNPLNLPDFSATQALQTAKQPMNTKVYRSGSSVRIERSAALSTLYVPASSKVYNLTTYPDGSHQCVAMKPEQAKMVPSPLELLNGTNVKKTASGTEVIDGHSCKVETVVVTRPDGTTIESKIWTADDLKGAPLKIESKLPHETLTASYSDVVIGTPDKALFTPPDKCTPFEKMGQVVEKSVIK